MKKMNKFKVKINNLTFLILICVYFFSCDQDAYVDKRLMGTWVSDMTLPSNPIDFSQCGQTDEKTKAKCIQDNILSPYFFTPTIMDSESFSMEQKDYGNLNSYIYNPRPSGRDFNYKYPYPDIFCGQHSGAKNINGLYSYQFYTCKSSFYGKKVKNITEDFPKSLPTGKYFATNLYGYRVNLEFKLDSIYFRLYSYRLYIDLEDINNPKIFTQKDDDYQSNPLFITDGSNRDFSKMGNDGTFASQLTTLKNNTQMMIVAVPVNALEDSSISLNFKYSISSDSQGRFLNFLSGQGNSVIIQSENEGRTIHYLYFPDKRFIFKKV